jgi:pseudaminic acid biosynthesis-associated methylase
MQNKQEQFWSGDFGKEYTNRNSRNPETWDKFYLENWGITKPDLNEKFLGNLLKEAKILEVGCNTGMQLAGLQRNGFEQLYGVELQPYAVEKAKEFTKNVNIIQGSGFDLPFKDRYFDVVCTNGVLIHISPNNLMKIMAEMVRCTKKYIWGWEYYASETTQINYRGNEDFLWKADYAQLFMLEFGLKLVKKEIYPYINQAESGNADCMYLLEK